MAEIVYKDESFKIIGACMRVHAAMGNGFLEAVYQEALEDELQKQDISFEVRKNWRFIIMTKNLRNFIRLIFFVMTR